MPPAAIASRVSSTGSRCPRASSRSRALAGGNFGAPPKPPLTGSMSSSSDSTPAVDDLRRRGRRRGGQPRDRAELLTGPAGGGVDLVALLIPGGADGLHHHPEPGHPLTGLGREVGAAVEGDAVGVAEGRQRPAAPAGHPLQRLHVDGVDVGSFLAVDLDRDEVLVHVGGGLGVGERLSLHDVAPVAGRVADREQDRDVALAGGCLRLFAPGSPVDRVVLVLEEVGRGLAGESVGHRRAVPYASQSGAGASPASIRSQIRARSSRSSVSILLTNCSRIPARLVGRACSNFLRPASVNRA